MAYPTGSCLKALDLLLKDHKKAYDDKEEIHTIARKGLKQDDATQ